MDLRLQQKLLLSPAHGQASTVSVGSEEGSSGHGSREGQGDSRWGNQAAGLVCSGASGFSAKS